MDASEANTSEQIELITLEDVQRQTKCSKTFLYQNMKYRRFPAPVKYGTLSRWVRSEVDAWIRQRIAERDSRAAA